MAILYINFRILSTYFLKIKGIILSNAGKTHIDLQGSGFPSRTAKE